MEINSFSLSFLLPIIFIILKRTITSLSSKCYRLPPGPRPWPIIGNAPHINKRLHVALAKIAKVHGPIISLKFSSQLVIVGSSPTAASEILKNQDRFTSSRSLPKALPHENSVLERIAIVWNPTCNEHWKKLRALCRTELFSSKAIESQVSLREKKLSELIQFLGDKEGQVINFGEVVFTTVFNTISNLLFSKDFISFEEGGMGNRLKFLVRESINLVTSPNLADFIPVIANLDLQGLKRKLSKTLNELFGEWESIIKERRERHANNDASNKDFLDVFLSNGFNDDQINWLVLELFNAGAETTTATIEWAMAELLKNEEAMKKLGEELDKEIKTNSIEESQLSQLSYLNACVKETLRLHPAVAVITHHTYEKCEIMNYTIPEGTNVFVNLWAMGRDPSYWEDPLSFKPERFLGSTLDVKSHNNFEYLPFGSGRRTCPGMPMAVRQFPLILASLIHRFDWSLPNGQDPAKLDMTSGKFGITAPKEKPLLVVPKRKF